MSRLKITDIQTSSGVSNISINPNTGQVTISSGIEPVVLNRANDNPNVPLLLTSFNEIHYYETTGSELGLYTQMLPDSLYEFTYTSSGGSENTDFVLYPNGLSYTGQFNSHYRFTTGSTGNFDQINQTGFNYVYFDHQGGGDGNESMGRMIIYTGNPAFGNKMCFYFGADDGNNVAYGYNRWTNDTVAWNWLGLLSFNGNNKRCWVRRIA